MKLAASLSERPRRFPRRSRSRQCGPVWAAGSDEPEASSSRHLSTRSKGPGPLKTTPPSLSITSRCRNCQRLVETVFSMGSQAHGGGEGPLKANSQARRRPEVVKVLHKVMVPTRHYSFEKGSGNIQRFSVHALVTACSGGGRKIEFQISPLDVATAMKTQNSVSFTPSLQPLASEMKIT